MPVLVALAGVPSEAGSGLQPDCGIDVERGGRNIAEIELQNSRRRCRAAIIATGVGCEFHE